MKLFDCTLYYDEDLILETRLNILNKYFDKFIICEAKYTHSGREKKLNFNINNFKEFKNKIIYLVQDSEPSGLTYSNIEKKENFKTMRPNAVLRIAHQRNKLVDGLTEAGNNDIIFYSDNDEIPDLSEFNFKNFKKKILIFEQKLFYYKFNLLCDRIFWYGSRAIKKKDLIDFEWFRQIKPKKYPLYRVDTLFKSNKYIDLKIIKNGGWHFTRVLSPEEIHQKELDAEHHDEYRLSKKDPAKIKDLIKRRVIDHNHLVDKTKDKYRDEFKLKKIPNKELPDFISNNIGKYKDFLDLED
jgi:beta-1,4-mannosyl-glycoprotein beta-1,4-N-acetylglucosaminyltransferase